MRQRSTRSSVASARSANRPRPVDTITGELAVLAESPKKAALVGQAAALRRRMKTGSQLVTALQVIAVVLMAVGHYV